MRLYFPQSLNHHSQNLLLSLFVGHFSFQVLNEIRHLFWDYGLGYDLKISKISGYVVVVGSFIFSVAFYLLGKGTLS